MPSPGLSHVHRPGRGDSCGCSSKAATQAKAVLAASPPCCALERTRPRPGHAGQADDPAAAQGSRTLKACTSLGPGRTGAVLGGRWGWGTPVRRPVTLRLGPAHPSEVPMRSGPGVAASGPVNPVSGHKTHSPRRSRACGQMARGSVIPSSSLPPPPSPCEQIKPALLRGDQALILGRLCRERNAPLAAELRDTRRSVHASRSVRRGPAQAPVRLPRAAVRRDQIFGSVSMVANCASHAPECRRLCFARCAPNHRRSSTGHSHVVARSWGRPGDAREHTHSGAGCRSRKHGTPNRPRPCGRAPGPSGITWLSGCASLPASPARLAGATRALCFLTLSTRDVSGSGRRQALERERCFLGEAGEGACLVAPSAARWNEWGTGAAFLVTARLHGHEDNGVRTGES